MDAGWSKRTHKHAYNALSAVGVIFWTKIGLLECTKQVLFYLQKHPTKAHKCCKNWSGTSSSSVESDLILEGFLATAKQHSVHYIKETGIALSVQHWCQAFQGGDTPLKSKNV